MVFNLTFIPNDYNNGWNVTWFEYNEEFWGFANYSFANNSIAINPEADLKSACWTTNLIMNELTRYVSPRALNDTAKFYVDYATWTPLEMIRKLGNVSLSVPSGENLTVERIITGMDGVKGDIAASLAEFSWDFGSLYVGQRDLLTGQFWHAIPGYLYLDRLATHFPESALRWQSSIFPPVFITLAIITGIVICLRFWSRKLVGGVRSYDWIILLGWVLTVAWGGVAYGQIQYLAKPTCGSTMKYVMASEFYFIVLDVLYPLALFVIKCSLLLFYYHLTEWRAMRFAVYFTSFFAFASTVVGIAMSVVTYNKSFYFVDIGQHDGTWYQRSERISCAIAGASLIIATDVLIWILPFPLLWRLNLSIREKIFAGVTFGLGTLACIASGYRLRELLRFLDPEKVAVDLFTTSVGVNFWALIELSMGIVCASIPALRVLVNRYLPKLIERERSNTARGGIVCDKSGSTSRGVSPISKEKTLDEEQAGEIKEARESFSHVQRYVHG